MAKVNRAAAVRMYVRLVKAGRMELDEVQSKLDPWDD